MGRLSVCLLVLTLRWSPVRANKAGVGHESGRHIVDILKRNPKKDADKYTDEDLQHMRKVVSYCKVSTLVALSTSDRY